MREFSGSCNIERDVRDSSSVDYEVFADESSASKTVSLHAKSITLRFALSGWLELNF